MNKKRYIKLILITLLTVILIFLKPIITLIAGELQGSLTSILEYNHILVTISFAWGLIVLTRLVKRIFLGRYDLTEEDNLTSRKIYTQVNILEKVIVSLIILFAAGFILLSFENIRKIGVGLFASAGVAGIILGLSAQKVMGGLLAGIQIAITQPFRIDDAVVVENEWGWIEEINLTYVVVRLWDKRRLVLPSTYFLETPFQNWTRSTAEITGSVYLYTDYRVQFGALRNELTRILEDTDLWDGQVNVLQVTSARESTVEIRILVSAKNSPTAWDLRVLVREKMIEFIRDNYPDSLPRNRILLENPERSE